MHFVRNTVGQRSDVLVRCSPLDSIRYVHADANGSYSFCLLDRTHFFHRFSLSLTTGKQEVNGGSCSSSELSPATAYANLKESLKAISEQSFQFAPLRLNSQLNLEHFLKHTCSTYESLLANAILNQVRGFDSLWQSLFIFFPFSDCWSQSKSLFDWFFQKSELSKWSGQYCWFFTFVRSLQSNNIVISLLSQSKLQSKL